MIGVLVGQLHDQDGWKKTLSNAFEALKEAVGKLNWAEAVVPHYRGSYQSVPHGISYGGGQQVSFPLISMPHSLLTRLMTVEAMLPTALFREKCRSAGGAYDK